MLESSIMPCRYEVLEYLSSVADDVYTPFIGYDGKNLISAGVSDDLGIFYFIPLIKRIFNLTLDQSITIFFYSITFIAFAIGLSSLFLIYKSISARILSFMGLLSLSIISLSIGDVYIAYSASSIAIMPLFLYCINQQKLKNWLIICSFIMGILIGFFHIIRAFSSTGPLLFILVLLLTHTSLSLNKKLVLLSALGCGIIIFPLYFKMLYHQYDNFASTHLPFYKKMTDKHIFWHSVYIGFGFLNNDFGIKYDDSIGANKAISIDPEAIYPSERYERVIKNEVFKLFKTQKQFVLSTIFAKTGMLFFILFSSGRYAKKWKNILTLFLNLLFVFGISLSFLYRKLLCVDIAFLIAILFNTLFGIVIIPAMSYLLGFVVCITLYCIVSTNQALEQGLMQDIYTYYFYRRNNKISLG